MKRTQHLWLIGLGVVACLACMIGGLSKTPVQAQTATDDGLFTVYVYLDYDSSNVVYGSTYYEADPFEDTGGYFLADPQIWNLSGGSYSAEGLGPSFSSGPVPGGNTYTAEVAYQIEYGSVDSACSFGPDGNGYECFDNLAGFASVDVPYPPATVTGISPGNWIAGQSYVGVQITGTNFGSTPSVSLDDPAIQITRQAYNTSTSGGTWTTYIDISVPSGTPSEPVTVTITPGSNGSSFVSGTGGSLSGSSTADVIGAQQNACPSDTDATSGFSSIKFTGLAGSGSMIVSFSHGSYNGFGVTVPYGPYSTPESIASHMAALITKQYARSGLTAQAYGANILYKGNATLGNATFTPSGPSGSSSDSSFTADPSPASCSPVSINLRLVPVMSVDEPQSSGTTILHTVWRLVTLNGTTPSGGSYTVFEHLPIKIGNAPVQDGQGGWQTPAPGAEVTRNKFDDGIGCTTMNIPILAPNNCITHPPYWQKFTITAGNDSGLNSGLTQSVMTRVPGQGDRLVMTINEHGYSAGTMNNDSGPVPQFSPDPYPQHGVYPCYFCQP